MDQVLPLSSGFFGALNSRHAAEHHPGYHMGGRPDDFLRGADAINAESGPVFTIHGQPNTGTEPGQLQHGGPSYHPAHHQHLFAHHGAPSNDYDAPAPSMQALGAYGTIPGNILPPAHGVTGQFSSTPAEHSLDSMRGFGQPSVPMPSLPQQMPSMANDQYSTGVPTPARDTGVGNLFSPIRGERKRNYTTSVPHRRINRFDVAPSERRYEPVTPKTPSTYNLADQTPRTVHQPQLPMSPPQPPAYHSSPFGYESGTNPSDPTAPVFAFGELREHAQLWTGGNLREMITPSIHCKSEKGLFFWEGEWIAYRRNYFSFSCEYTLGPKANQSPLWVQNGEKVSQVQALGVCLSAAVDGANGKKIELVQFTAKRDQGPKTSVAMRKIFPVPPPTKDAGHFGGLLGSHQYAPMLPLQQVSDNQTPQMAGQLPSCSTLFERLQFKSATANNGKRRAQQQYFHINAELWADIRLSPNDPEQWVRVASRTSESVVVRGRSPSHYKLQANQAGGRGGGHGNNHRGGGAPGGAAGGMAGGSHLGWSSMPGYPGSGRGYSSMPNSGGGKSSYGGSYHRAADGIDHHGNAVDDLSPASSRSSTMMGPPTIVPVIPPATFGPPQFGPPLQRSTDPGYSYYNPSLAPRYDSYVAVVADMPRPIKTDAITPVTLSTTIETNTITATTNANSTHDRYEKPILGSSKGHYTTVSNTF